MPLRWKVLARLNACSNWDEVEVTFVQTQKPQSLYCVYINRSLSSLQQLSYGVPQGSRPLLFSIYPARWCYNPQIWIRNACLCGWHTDLCVGVPYTTADGVRHAVSRVEQCVMKIEEWMSNNFLKLNAEKKTEILIFGFRDQLAKFSITHVQIAGVDIPVLSKPIKNLGVMFDCHMSMSAQVANIIKAANFQLVNIGRARKLLQQTPLNSLSIPQSHLVWTTATVCSTAWMNLSSSNFKTPNALQHV